MTESPSSLRPPTEQWPNYRKRPVAIHAQQWSKEIDHPEVLPYWTDRWVKNVCPQCRRGADRHGRIPTLEGEHIVCPGDWIITGVHGEHYPCKPDIFAKTYEPIDTRTPSEVKPAESVTHDELRLILEADKPPHELADDVLERFTVLKK